jgi:hypothetical protein
MWDSVSARAVLSASLMLTVLTAEAGGAEQSPSQANDPGPPTAARTVPQEPVAAAGQPASTGSNPGKAAQARPAPSRYSPDRFSGRAGVYYGLVWGVDSVRVRLVESGELVRFTYRVVDPEKARILNDKQSEAKLEDPKAGVSLVVPTMEKIGQLRQTSAAEAGRTYWMTFSNKGRRVARGDRVDVVIGPFKASNLVVD